jgi:N-acetylglucosaminyldiphosphoundecaprenol N-acetyl-beta-D-mannosaminyltransferase
MATRQERDTPASCVELDGIALQCMTRAELVEQLDGSLERGAGGWIITLNVDHVQRVQRIPRVRECYAKADWIVADGMPLLWAAALQGTPLPDRVAGSDLVWTIAERAAKRGRSLYLLGGAAGAAEAAARVLTARWPELRIAGISSPDVSEPATPAELDAIRSKLAKAEPDIVYVALGAPKAEYLIAALREAFPRTWWIGVGISLSFIAGTVQRAPVWVQRSGLEWLHRLAQEPRRLARRYLIDDLPFTAGFLWRAWRRGRRAA